MYIEKVHLYSLIYISYDATRNQRKERFDGWNTKVISFQVINAKKKLDEWSIKTSSRVIS